MEKEIVDVLRNHFGRDLVAVLVEGSYAFGEHVQGVSDHDTQVFIRNFRLDRLPPNVTALCQKYGIEISPAIRSYDDFKNRVRDNRKATRFLTNLTLIDFKLKSRLIFGKDIRKEIPAVREMLKRDLSADLRELYYKMTNVHPAWNVLRRGPDEWIHCMVNLAYGLVLSEGTIAKKSELPELLCRLHPKFNGVQQLEKALDLRRGGRVHLLSAKEKKEFRQSCESFLDSYREYLFFS